MNRREMVIGSIKMLRNRALARARALELDFTTGGNEEEDTMCPVCQESTPLSLPHSRPPYLDSC
jgi:hypothetical protein